MPIQLMTKENTSPKEKMSSVQPVDMNPNNNPEAFFKLYDELDHIESKKAIAFDVSGSQQGEAGRSLIPLISKCTESKSSNDTAIYPFGDDQIMPPYSNIRDFYNNFCSNASFSYGTLTVSLNNFINKVNEQGYTRIFIEGDGDFGGYSNGQHCSRQVEEKKFLDNLETVDLNIQSITLLFTGGTGKAIQDNLTDKILNIIGRCTNAIEFSSIELPKLTAGFGDANVSYLNDILEAANTSVNIPPNFCLVGTLFAIDKRLTNVNIAKILSKREHLIPKLYEYMKNIIETKPSLLLRDENSILGKLHNVLKIVVGEEYMNWISLTKQKATGVQLEALVELIDKSYNKEAEIDDIIKKIQPFCIGYGVFPDVNISHKDIMTIVKDGTCVSLMKFLKSNLHKIQFIKKTTKHIELGKGMLILRPSVKDKTLEYKKLMRMAAQTLFLQWGHYLIQGSRAYIAGLVTITHTEGTIHKIFKKCAEVSIFGDAEYTYQMLGFKPEDKKLFIPDILWNPIIMRLLAKCVIGFPNELFEDMNEQVLELIEMFSQFLNMHNKLKSFKALDYSLKRTKTEIIGTSIKRGDIVSVTMPWNLESQVNLPAVGVVTDIRRRSKKIRIKFLDRPFNVVDNSPYINISYTTLLADTPTPIVIEEVNKYLVKMQKEGASGIYKGNKGDLGSQMKTDAWQTDLRKVNDDELKEYVETLMTKHCSDNKVVTRTIPIDIPIPTDKLVDILKNKFRFNSHFQSLLKSNAKFTRKDTEIGSFPNMECDPSIKPKVSVLQNKIDYLVHDDEIDELYELYEKGMIDSKIKSVSTSNIKECPICGKESHFRNFTFFGGCCHDVCIECDSYYNEHTKYSPGDIINKSLHCCAVCRHATCRGCPELEPIFEKHKGVPPSNIVLRICAEPGCGKIYESLLGCGMEPSHVPDKCEQHEQSLLDDDSIKQCFKCKNAISFSYGCDHMHCTAKMDNGETCNAHWCFKCEYRFSDDIISNQLDSIAWVCDGPCSIETEKRHIEELDDDDYYP